MSTRKHAVTEHMRDLADDARGLIAATADVAHEGVAVARKKLAATVESAKDTYELAQQRALDGAKAADKIVRTSPYQMLGVALGIGAVIGFLVGRRQ